MYNKIALNSLVIIYVHMYQLTTVLASKTIEIAWAFIHVHTYVCS